MNVRDVVYETARQFSEIAASQHWIQQRIGDLNAAAKEITAALENQKKWFREALGIAQEMREKTETKGQKAEENCQKAETSENTKMKIGHVEIKVRQFSDQRWGFDDYTQGQRRMVRCRTKAKALARATDTAVLLANGRGDLLQVHAGELAEFRQWKSGVKQSPPIAQAHAEFLALKTTKSHRYVRSIKDDLESFGEFIGPTTPIGEIMAIDIQRFLSSRNVGQRRQFNLRAGIVSLFRWARRMSYLPDRTTEAERVEPIEKVPGQANVLTPDQMRMLLDNVRPEYLPWLVIGGFAGVRSEEIAPDPKSRKSPLMWEDFDWQHKTLVVRAETAKTKEEREVPIADNLAQWLAPWRNAKGPVIDAEQPSRRETARLGASIGGWKHNALRDSFCSYRTRITQNVPQVSYEMGNSIAMVKRSYHRRQPIHTAEAWFDLRPSENTNVITFAA